MRSPNSLLVGGNMHLVALTGPDAGQAFAVDGRSTICIGRGDECQIRLRDPSVSRVQFEIQFADGQATLKDAGSRWGTLVNGVKTASHILRSGDVIRIGDTELRWGTAPRAEATTIAPALRSTDPLNDLAAPARDRPPELPASDLSRLADGRAAPNSSASTIPDPRRLIGQRLANYHVQRVQAESRSGIVFLALDRDSGQPVALKVFWPEWMHQPDAVGRFLRAIETMRSVRHPNLVALLDAGRTDGLCWMATEFVAGESAKQVILRVGIAGMLDWKFVHRVTCDVARALEFAASEKVVHRNITPTNILIRQSDGVAKLGDLVLAKAFEELGPDRITRAGDIVGDLPYLSPEQTAGIRIDHRSDLYSLGATAYALLTGRPPCEGLTTADTVLKIQTQRPDPPTTFHLAVPAIFEGVVMRLLAKRPDDRFVDASHLLAELDRVEKYTWPVESRDADPDAG
jgi:hypothetical protein